MIQKLANVKFDTSLLRSSRNLAPAKTLKRNGPGYLQERYQSNNSRDIDKHGLDDSVDQGTDSESYESDAKPPAKNEPKTVQSEPSFGIGLKRPFEIDPDGLPIIKKRKRLHRHAIELKTKAELPWEGLSTSSDSDLLSTYEKLDDESGKPLSESEADHEKRPESLIGSDSGSDLSEAIDDYGSSHSNEEIKSTARLSAFKIWASQQALEALGISLPNEQTDSINHSEVKPAPKVEHRKSEMDPLPAELQSTSRDPSRKVFSVPVDRPPELQEMRLKLPITAEEQKIMEAIYNNPVVVIWGATGSGKTTQVPQFLYEAGFGNSQSPTPGMIGVTQPRRVAAVSMASRVGIELGGAVNKVSYQIRFESSISNDTAIKFMTDGILIREIAKDFALLKYSVIIIDEAHERSVNTDILIGMLSRIIDLRASMSKENESVTPLKLIIMSATLRIADFIDNPNLFRTGPPPLMQVEGRQYSVSIHFARRTSRDYLEEVFKKVCKGHKKLPPGAMLVFLTGRNEITAMCQRLRKAFESSSNMLVSAYKVQLAASDLPLETEDFEFGRLRADFGDFEDYSSDEENQFEEGDDQAFNIDEAGPKSSRIHVLPLYSQLQTKDQLRIFEPPPENSRLIVLATNVAETSLTIPGIRYVFDCGRAKEKRYDKVSGVQNFEIGWISKASASQRAGRAGRTGPGHCYRLYSSAVFERDFEEYPEPEISRMPAEGVVLLLKSMDLHHVINFPFPTPPSQQSLAKAEKQLAYLGALTVDGKITPVGHGLSQYPLSPRFSKMLLIGHQHGCMPYTIALVAALAVQNIFIPENQLEFSIPSTEDGPVDASIDRPANTAWEQRRKDYNKAHSLLSKNSPTSDALKSLAALCSYAYASETSVFCAEMFLNPKSLEEASSLRQQISTIVHNNQHGLVPIHHSRLPSPSSLQITALQQIVAAAFIDQIAIRADLSPAPPDLPRKPSHATNVPYLPLFPSHGPKSHELVDIAVFIHPSSILARLAPKDLPQYVIYSHLQRASPKIIGDAKVPKTRMHALGTVSGKQIAALAKGTPLLRYGKPIGKITEDGLRREYWSVPELVGEQGKLGWPLPAVKISEKKGAGGWIIEQVVG